MSKTYTAESTTQSVATNAYLRSHGVALVSKAVAELSVVSA